MELLKVDYRDLLEMKMWLEELAIRRAADCATKRSCDRLIDLGGRLNRLAASGSFSHRTRPGIPHPGCSPAAAAARSPSWFCRWWTR
jgi:hypothetical protein